MQNTLLLFLSIFLVSCQSKQNYYQERLQYVSKIMTTPTIQINEGDDSIELSYKTFDLITKKSGESPIKEVADKMIGSCRSLDSYLISYYKWKVRKNVRDEKNIDHYFYQLAHDTTMYTLYNSKMTELSANRENPMVIINVAIPGIAVAKEWYSLSKKESRRTDKYLSLIEDNDTYTITLRKKRCVNPNEYQYCLVLYMVDLEHCIGVEYSFYDGDLDNQALEPMIQNIKSLKRDLLMHTDHQYWDLRERIQA